jgi:uncharacterized membrane protein HdeD (DUF308 family)
MTTENVNHVDDSEVDVRAALRRHWVLFLIPGVVMTVLGFFAAAFPFVATLVVKTFAGWLFLTSAFVGIASLFTTRSVPGFAWTLLSAILAIVVGAFLVWRPLAGAVTLTLALAAYFAAHGIAQILASLAHRQVLAQSWMWTLASGVADLILTAIIIMGWPGSVVWAIGLVVGIHLFMAGSALVMTAIACRGVNDASEHAAPARHVA